MATRRGSKNKEIKMSELTLEKKSHRSINNVYLSPICIFAFVAYDTLFNVECK